MNPSEYMKKASNYVSENTFSLGVGGMVRRELVRKTGLCLL